MCADGEIGKSLIRYNPQTPGMQLIMFDFGLRIMQVPPLMKREYPAQSTQDMDIRVNAICGE